jgi:hypothetical protein
VTKRFRLTRPEPKEADVLSAVLTALAMHPRVAWAHRFNVGAGKLVRKNGASQWMKFGFPGCPDILGQLRTGELLAVEVKRPSGKESPEQVAFLDCVRANGGVAVVARSVDDLWAALQPQGGPR